MKGKDERTRIDFLRSGSNSNFLNRPKEANKTSRPGCSLLRLFSDSPVPPGKILLTPPLVCQASALPWSHIPSKSPLDHRLPGSCVLALPAPLAFLPQLGTGFKCISLHLTFMVDFVGMLPCPQYTFLANSSSSFSSSRCHLLQEASQTSPTTCRLNFSWLLPFSHPVSHCQEPFQGSGSNQTVGQMTI